MAFLFFVFLSALWLGVLTSISPCPLATNVAAISFLSKKIIHPKAVFWASVFYILGRMLTYAVLGFIIVFSFISVPVLANFLQKYMNRLFGPTLIITGLFLFDIIKFKFKKINISQEHQDKLAQSGLGGSFILGFLFALVFCPVSAALFFGSLIPLALSNKFGLSLPFIYGIGTGLPVLLFSVAAALGIKALSQGINILAGLEFYMRKITGVIFILVGLYYTKIYLLDYFFNLNGY